MGRQHQGMDRPGVRQVPEGSGEQGKMGRLAEHLYNWMLRLVQTVSVLQLMRMENARLHRKAFNMYRTAEISAMRMKLMKYGCGVVKVV